MANAVTTERLRCEARLSLGPVICRQVVGVHAIVDATGTVRGACSREGHEANVIRRYGMIAGSCCGAGGSTPHWVGCPQHPKAMAPGELVEMYGR